MRETDFINMVFELARSLFIFHAAAQGEVVEHSLPEAAHFHDICELFLVCSSLLLSEKASAPNWKITGDSISKPDAYFYAKQGEPRKAKLRWNSATLCDGD